MKIDDVPRAPGIYRITCNKNKRVYVGQSTNMRDRAGYHIRHLKCGSHTNKHLQNAWNKYGEGSFVIDVLERCPKSFDVLNEREIYWINKLDALARGRGFNIATGGSNGYSLGGMPEGERAAILEKIAAKTRGRKTGKRAHNYGKRMTDEQRAKLSQARKEYYKHHPHPNKGREMSEEQIEKLRIANSGSGGVWFGKKRPEHAALMAGGGNPRARPIVCLNTGEQFECAKDAESVAGTTNSNILKCCRGTQRYAGRAPDGAPLIWAYL